LKTGRGVGRACKIGGTGTSSAGSPICAAMLLAARTLRTASV